MVARRIALLVVALSCTALLAACGSSGSSTTGGSTAASTPATSSTAASTPATTASSPASTTTARTSKSATTTPAAPLSATEASGVKEYAAICKLIIAREPTLPASTKSKVEGICSKAAAGNLAAARAASKEVCVEVINASPLPAARKAKDIAACKLT